MPIFFKICCSVTGNVPIHKKIASVKFKWNRFIFKGATKPLKNKILLEAKTFKN